MLVRIFFCQNSFSAILRLKTEKKKFRWQLSSRGVGPLKMNLISATLGHVEAQDVLSNHLINGFAFRISRIRGVFGGGHCTPKIFVGNAPIPRKFRRSGKKRGGNRKIDKRGVYFPNLLQNYNLCAQVWKKLFFSSS